MGTAGYACDKGMMYAKAKRKGGNKLIARLVFDRKSMTESSPLFFETKLMGEFVLAPTSTTAQGAESRAFYQDNTAYSQPNGRSRTAIYHSESTATQKEKSTHCHRWGSNL
jgi:hypothetical protein